MTDLADRLAALDEAISLGREGRLEPDEVARLDQVRAGAGQRLARGEGVVVAALAGGTGSGKSSLFNALVGSELAGTGIRRPITTHARAAVIGDPDGSGAMLDWLDVDARHHLADVPGLEPGLVLVDLPDHDSVDVEHREVVDRFVARVDVLVWVVDPRKYAQRALHVGYLRDLAAHAEVTLVVLNRVDELTADERTTVVADLRGLLDAEGLGAARLLTTSATAGRGLAELRTELADETRTRRAIAARVAADVVTAAAVVAGSVEPTPPAVDVDRTGLVAAVGEAFGLQGIAEDARRAYQQDAKHATRPLVSSWVVSILSLVFRPLRRWRSERVRRRSVALAAPAGDIPVGVRHAVLELVDTGVVVEMRWQTRLRRLAEAAVAVLRAGLARELDRVELTPRPRRWWTAVAALWTLVETALIIGVGWLTASAVLVWLQLPPLPSPDAVGAISWPTALTAAGGVAWSAIAALRRRVVDRGSRRHARTVAATVRSTLETSVRATVVEPLEHEVEAIHRLAAALGRASA